MIDLHCHSYYSDGALSPEDLLAKAIQADIHVLALTDHDTTEGLQALHLAARGKSIQIIDGIELSVRWKKFDIHILGLNIQPDDIGLCDLIVRQNEHRISRAQLIGDRLKVCGVENAYGKACERAGHQRVGRAHYAALLLEEGLVHDMQSAFKRFLGRGQVAYVASTWVDMVEAVTTIVQAKGQAVIAHPLKYGLTRTKLLELIKTFIGAGGVGMEVVSGNMSMIQIKELAGLCCRYQLLASTGSDYHGDALSHTKLGRQGPLPINCTPIWQPWNM
ncbi:MAG: PHP domain-containing protein [Legionellales bacterium]|nr:PHP domain-containing protein [Legionellales bacterium]